MPKKGKNAKGTSKGDLVVSYASQAQVAPNGQTEHPRIVARKKRPLQPIEHLLGEKVVNAEGTSISPSTFAVEDGVIGLYFAAQWCPPCRALFPQLMLLYEEVRKEETNKFEVVYVSFDSSVETFKSYFGKMPWWAVDYDDSDRREELVETYHVNGIPVFLLIDANTLEVINKDGRVFIKLDPRGNDFPWRDLKAPSPSPPASEAVAEALAAVAAAKELLDSCGSAYRVARSSNDEEGAQTSNKGMDKDNNNEETVIRKSDELQ